MKQYVLFLSMLFCCANFSLKAETLGEMIDRKSKDFGKEYNLDEISLDVKQVISILFANHPENECAEYREEALKYLLSGEKGKEKVIRDTCEKIYNYFARTVRDEDHSEDHSMEKVMKEEKVMEEFWKKHCKKK